MTIRTVFAFLILAAMLVVPSDDAFAQDVEVVEPPAPRASPLMMTRYNLDGRYVKITYSAPQRRDREIFGSLVPYGEVWRTGANEATELTIVGGGVRFGDVELDEGTYALFTIPNADEWTVIVNNGVGQWGHFAYDESLDVGRFMAASEEADKQYEAFTIAVEEVDATSAKVWMVWDRTGVGIPLAAID